MKIITTSVLAAIAFASAAPASAQRYYMRERIRSLQTPQPTTAPPTPSQPSVTYSWATGSWISSSGCADVTSQHRSVQCVSSAGGVAADSNCTGTRPTTSQTGSNYSGCTYTLHDHGYGACSGGTRPHYYDCMRSDGRDGIFVTQCSAYPNNPVMEPC